MRYRVRGDGQAGFGTLTIYLHGPKLGVDFLAVILYNIGSNVVTNRDKMVLGRDLITVKEASEKTGYNAEYLRRLIRQDEIEAYKVGTVYLIFTDSLQRYVDKMKSSAHHLAGPRSFKT